MFSTIPLKGKFKMTTKEAIEQIIAFRNENVSFEEIAEKLKERGYRSERTKEPITAQTARWMFKKATGTLKSPTQAATRSRRAKEIVEVSTGPKGDLLELAKMIINNDKMSIDFRVESLRRLVKDDATVMQ